MRRHDMFLLLKAMGGPAASVWRHEAVKAQLGEQASLSAIALALLEVDGLIESSWNPVGFLMDRRVKEYRITQRGREVLQRGAFDDSCETCRAVLA